MEDYSRRRHEEAGYEFVYTPHITKGKLFETSGHLDWYADGMYPPMQLDEGADYYLKPMNCPMHNLIFDARGRSYRELPLRLFEFGTVYRYEKSGVVHGLTRVRGFTQDDAHIYCTQEQMADELDSPAHLRARPAARLRPGRLLPGAVHPGPGEVRRLGRGWDEATEALRQAAEKQGLELVPDPGGAAFYGPKISVQARDAIGRTWQMSTIQVDFNLPERFDLEYTGRRRRPAAAGDDPPRAVRLDRAVLRRAARALRRRVPGLAGAGAGGRHPGRRRARAYLRGVRRRGCGRKGMRVEVDASDDRMQKKIRNAQKQKVPFMLIAGDEDVDGRRGVLPATATARRRTACRCGTPRRSREHPWPGDAERRSAALFAAAEARPSGWPCASGRRAPRARRRTGSWRA